MKKEGNGCGGRHGVGPRVGEAVGAVRAGRGRWERGGAR